MREGWTRGTAAWALDAQAVARLIEPLYPGATVARLEPAQGGLANTNIRVELSGRPEALLLRLYQRDPAQARKEAALHRLVASRVPVPRFLHVAEDNPVTGQPYAIMPWIEGTRLETVLASLDGERVAGLGRAIGQTLGAIHGFTFEHYGFLDAELGVADAVDLGGDGLLAYLDRCLVAGRGADRLGQALTAALLDFAAREGGRLEAWLGTPSLIHSDFNGSNILVRRQEGSAGLPGAAWEVAAVLDWEFAFSGSPAFDFGNLLRPPLGDAPGFAAAVAEGYRQAGGILPADWRRIARIADLHAWAEFLDRPDPGAALIDDARRVIQDTISDRAP